MLLEANNLTFSFKKGDIVFKNLNFLANDSDLICVLGPNGAGKTTFLKCIMGFLKPQCGTCTLDGKNILNYSHKDFWDKVSYVPQVREQNSSLCVLEMILLGLSSKIGIFASPTDKDVQKAKQVSESLNISHLLTKKCNEISGGELQLILIARAIISEPQILILDEPESGLDFKNQIIVLDTLERLARSGMCIIFNTHYPEHALARANKSLLIYDDGTADFGNTEEILNVDKIKNAFGVDTIIKEYTVQGKSHKCIISVKLSDNTTS